MNHREFTIWLWEKHGQPPKPNYYSSKPCECCGTYHGFCKIKIEYFIDTEEYDIYPEDRADYECDGCKYFKNCDDSFVFDGQNPKIDCPHFRPCGFCQGTGVYPNQLIEFIGSKWQGIMDTGEDPEDQYKFENAVRYYRHGLSHNNTSSLNCPADAYLSDNMPCPFCHDDSERESGKLEDPMEVLLVAIISNDLFECGSFEDVAKGFTALNTWQSMKFAKKYFPERQSYNG